MPTGPTSPSFTLITRCPAWMYPRAGTCKLYATDRTTNALVCDMSYHGGATFFINVNRSCMVLNSVGSGTNLCVGQLCLKSSSKSCTVIAAKYSRANRSGLVFHHHTAVRTSPTTANTLAVNRVTSSQRGNLITYPGGRP